MDAAVWKQIESICLAALDRGPEERAGFLEQACGSDQKLRREVDSLLRQLKNNPEFLENPLVRVSELAGTPDDEGIDEPKYIGPYRLVRPLGRGGMGEVHLAIHEGEDFKQSVAVKVIRRGMDTDEVLKRFRLERQILASLHHSNIAQLIDGAATNDGRPYFVMEYVEGLPINEYCDRHRLSIPQRLEFFQVICSAVQHAHQNLVVHRDLKPSNILVTNDGVPKLLDFGIGKVLAPSPSIEVSLHTQTDMRILTPEYASPEQIRGEPVTTATDVYGLGILLYELLTGHHPYATGKDSLEDIEQAVCEANPSRPSVIVNRTESRPHRDGTSESVTPDDVSQRRATDPNRLRRRLSGDLDNIVLKALRKEPQRRYASAASLADDIQRHLDGLPVTARPDTLVYRARKFVGRHAVGVAAAAVMFLALAATTVVTLVQSQRVARESERVTQERDKALEVRGFLMEMFGAVGADQATADTVTARQLLDLQAARVDEAYQDQPELQAEILEVLADGYERLGLYDDAEPLARKSLEIRRRASGETDPDLATSLNMLGWILHQRGDSKEAEPLLREAVQIRRAAGDRYRLELSRSLNDLGVQRDNAGDYDEAGALYREALDIRLELLGDEHRSVAITANNLAVIYYRLGQYQQAVEMGERALSTLQKVVGPDHRRSIIAQHNLATFRIQLGDDAAAAREYRDLLQRQTRLGRRDDPGSAGVMYSLATVINRLGEQEEAESLLREALAIQEAKLGPSHRATAATLERLGTVLAARGALQEAVAIKKRALAIQRQIYGTAHFDIAETLSSLGRLYWRMGQRAEGVRLQREAMETYEESVGHDHNDTNLRRAWVCDQLLKLNRPGEALPYCEEAHAIYLRKRPATHRLVHQTRHQNVRAQIALGNYDRADSLLAESRIALETGEARDRERKMFDSLTAVLEALTSDNR